MEKPSQYFVWGNKMATRFLIIILGVVIADFIANLVKKEPFRNYWYDLVFIFITVKVLLNQHRKK